MRFKHSIGDSTYKSLYSQVRIAVQTGKFKDRFSEMIGTLTGIGALGGVYRELPYVLIFDTAKNLFKRRFDEIRLIDKETGKIEAACRDKWLSSAANIFARFYQCEKGYWLEISSVTLRGAIGYEKARISPIIDCIYALSASTEAYLPIEIKTLDERIEEF